MKSTLFVNFINEQRRFNKWLHNDNKAHARKGKSLVEFSAKKYFLNVAENSKFTFYC